MKTRGGKLFKDWIDRSRMTQLEAARFFDFDPGFVSQLIRGKRTPGLENAVLIHKHTGIPPEAWVDTADGEAPTGECRSDEL